jgi:hypothetical protein
MATIADRCREEVDGLHRFFEQWFRGELEATPSALDRVRNALDDEFSVLFPSGNRVGRIGLLAQLERAHGGNRDLGDRFSIRIEGFEVVWQSRTAAVVRYEEWHEIGERIRARASTAVFKADSSSPHGVRWLHLQETWLPGRGDAVEAP